MHISYEATLLGENQRSRRKAYMSSSITIGSALCTAHINRYNVSESVFNYPFDFKVTNECKSISLLPMGSHHPLGGSTGPR